MKLFTNWTEADFSYTWNSVSYTFKANTSTELEDGIALHFAKHLAQRELNNAGRPTDDPSMEEMMNKCFGQANVKVAETPVTINQVLDILEETPIASDTITEAPEVKVEEVAKPKNKGGRPKKANF